MSELAHYPPPDRWDDWVELDAAAWPERVERRYRLVPTTCFNCEANCGLLAYVDRDTGRIDRFEGNPEHPASRGRNCAKGPATVNQVHDPERILHPLKRAGARGGGDWQRISWDQALAEIGARIRTAFLEGRHDEVMYHVGRPGDDSYMERVLHAWGIDGHNSHTNICSSGARVGYATWMGFDRPSADYAEAGVIFLISSHLEAGHYFNPHAQRIMEGKARGATVICVDPRLSNTGSVADHWLPCWPGTEAALLLAVARLLVEAGTWDREFVRRWVNWEQFLAETRPDLPQAFDSVGPALLDLYAEHTPEEAARVCGIDAEQIREVAVVVGRHLGRFASHNWRASAAGNLGGWQTSRCLFLLAVLTGSVGTVGGTSPNGWNKFIPVPPKHSDPQARWNELSWPIEYPLAHHEMSMLLPHLLKDGRARLDTYFTRVYNPIWTNPDGFTWLEVLTDESLVGCHVALTPTWSETAWFADYVLPMGLSAERHDVASYETHAGRWIGFRQPVLRRHAELEGGSVERTWETNPGEVWEEDELWIDLSWRIDPDGSLGIRGHFESDERPGEPITHGRVLRAAVRDGGAGPARGGGRRGHHPARAHAAPGRLRAPGRSARRARAGGHGRRPRRRGAGRRRGAAGGRDGRPVTTGWRTSPATCRSSATAPSASRSTGSCGPGSRRRRASWSSTPPRCATGGGPSTPSRCSSAATSTGRTSTSTAASASCCPRSGSRRSSTPAPPTASGSTRSATATPSGSTRPTPSGSASTWAAWSGS